MALQPGRDLAHYRIQGKIGEGGMGEVYRATDSKLGRDVAIKVLPQALSGDPERLARFQREAHVLASLNHPNIAAIYGLEDVDGLRFLVLELVEGVDLAERLARGPVPATEALDIARQVADALETAHEQGIVHRDLKPANVKLTPDGKVKVLDFGLAKALQTSDSGEVNASLSPTITSLATQDGIILGTAAYMSPEQARGGTVDRRSDIWAFGCLLLELLTGGNPFREPTVSDTLASILRSEPDLDRVPDEVSAPVRRLLRRCLTKDPRRRLRDIGEARIAIEEVIRGEADEDAPLPKETTPRASSLRWATITAAAVLLTAAVTTLITRGLQPRTAEPAARQFEAISGAFDTQGSAPPVLSPDGAKVVFSRDDRLWVRRLNQLEPIRLEGTEAATHPAWTPDSESIVFVSVGSMKSVPASGGTVSTLAFGLSNYSDAGSVSCAPDGTRCVYASGNDGLGEVPARGGEARVVLEPVADTEADFHDPAFLPDGGVVFVVHRLRQGPDTLVVFRDGERKDILQIEQEALSSPVYSPTGHILYHRAGARAGLWAVPFSLAGLETTGDPFLITPNGNFPSVSADGTLLYVDGAESRLRQLLWVDRDGKLGEPVGPPQTGVAKPALSPDGSRVAAMAEEDEQGNISIFDIGRGTRSRLTFGPSMDWDPTWMPDGKEVVFWEGVTRALSRTRADGSGQPARLMKQDLLDSGNPCISPDGKWMVFWAKPSSSVEDLWALDLTGDGTPVPLLTSPFKEDVPRISPDGNLLAYESNESGRTEIYLTRFPGAEGKWQVSVNGGAFPVWSPAGGELFYLEGTTMKQVDVTLDAAPRLGTPRTLFDAAAAGLNVIGNARFDISRDGRRFLMLKNVRTQELPPRAVIHYDWTAAYRR